MLAVVAVLQIQEGKQAEFENVARGLAVQVHANEPGCKHYQLCKARTPGLYYVLERYVDKAAFDHHGSTDYFKAAAGRMASMFAGPPKIEVLEEID